MSMDDYEITSSSSSSRNSRKPIGYPSFDHDEHGSLNQRNNYMIRWKSGKRVDEKLLNLLEAYFQELYLKRNDFFKKIFPGHVYDQFVDVFNKIGAVLSKNYNGNHVQTVQRSLSFGSTETRLEWFKVKTPDVVVLQPASDSPKQTN